MSQKLWLLFAKEDSELEGYLDSTAPDAMPFYPQVFLYSFFVFNALGEDEEENRTDRLRWGEQILHLQEKVVDDSGSDPVQKISL